jgi:hypothetical protein
MASLIHPAPSVGGVLKRVLEINPDLTVPEAVQIIRGAIERQGGPSNEFAQAETINEARALELARESISQPFLPNPTN